MIVETFFQDPLAQNHLPALDRTSCCGSGCAGASAAWWVPREADPLLQSITIKSSLNFWSPNNRQIFQVDHWWRYEQVFAQWWELGVFSQNISEQRYGTPTDMKLSDRPTAPLRSSCALRLRCCDWRNKKMRLLWLWEDVAKQEQKKGIN